MKPPYSIQASPNCPVHSENFELLNLDKCKSESVKEVFQKNQDLKGLPSHLS